MRGGGPSKSHFARSDFSMQAAQNLWRHSPTVRVLRMMPARGKVAESGADEASLPLTEPSARLPSASQTRQFLTPFVAWSKA